MRRAFLAVSSLILCGVSAAHAIDNLYSKLPYRRADGWVWDWRTRLWRSPQPVQDPQTKKWVYETQLPSSTACCDRTGLWFPGGSVNEDEFAAPDDARRPPSPRRAGQPSPDGSSTAARNRDPNSVANQVDAIRASGMSKADQDRLIRALEAKRQGRNPDNVGSVMDEDPGSGAASAMYRGLSGQSAGQLEGTASARRRDPSNDPSVMDIVGAGLAAGSAVGGLRGASGPRSGGTAIQGSGTRAPPRSAYPQVPRNPFQSDISGTH